MSVLKVELFIELPGRTPADTGPLELAIESEIYSARSTPGPLQGVRTVLARIRKLGAAQ